MVNNAIVDNWNDLVSYISYLGEQNSSSSYTPVTREEVEQKIQQAIGSASGSIDAQTILDTVYGKGYQTSEEVQSIVNTKISALVDSAPENLDTLKELADAIALIPTKTSQLINDSSFITEHQSLAEYAKTSDIEAKISVEIAKVVSDAPDSLDTLKEIADWISTHSQSASAMNSSINENALEINNIKTNYALKSDIPSEYDDTSILAKVTKLENADNVEWIESVNNRKHIILKNHDTILGTGTNCTEGQPNGYAGGEDLTGTTYNIAMVSKWNVADFGSNKLKMNLNSKSGKIYINDDKEIATVDQIPTVPTKVSELVNDSNYLTEHQSLDNYPTISQVNAELTAIDASISEIKTALNGKQPVGDYLTSVPSDYKTKTENDTLYQAKGNYLTEHQSLAEYAKTSEVNAKVSEEIAKIVTDAPETFDTLKEISDWISSHSESAAAMNSSISKNSLDITDIKTNYALKSELYDDSSVLSRINNLESVENVEWIESTNNRKHIILKNHDNILGTGTNCTEGQSNGYEGGEDLTGVTYNLAMVSKWNVADFGSTQLKMNLNSKNGKVYINDDKEIATVEQIPSVPTKVSELLNDSNYLTEHQSLEEYAKINQVNAELAVVDASISEIKTALAGKLSVGNYLTEVPSDYKTKTENDTLYQAKGNYLTEHQSLSEYAKIVQVNNEIEVIDASISEIKTALAGKQPIGNYLTEHQSLANYPTISQVNVELATIDASISEIKTALNGKQPVGNYLTSVPTDYKTKIENDTLYQAKGDYLTEHQSLAEYAKTSELVSLISQLKTRISILEASNTVMKYATSADTIAAISSTESKNTDLVVTTSEAVDALTEDKTFKSIAVVGGETNQTLKINATDSVVIDGLQVNGQKDDSNGKINYTTPDLTVKNAVINANNSNYNVFEGSKKPTESDTLNSNILIENMSVDGTNLTHNVINVYTPATDAKIVIKDSSFDINAACTNVLRISNIANADNVEVLFENVDWTYENLSGSVSEADWKWAGLILYQAYGSDSAYNGDLSHIATWSFKFKNCKYNGVKVTANNFGQHNVCGYSYDINKSKTVSDLIATGASFVFE